MGEVESAYRDYVATFDIEIDTAFKRISQAFKDGVKTPDQAREVVALLLTVDWDTFLPQEHEPVSLRDWIIRTFRSEQRLEVSAERQYWFRKGCICARCNRFDGRGRLTLWRKGESPKLVCSGCRDILYALSVKNCLNCGVEFLPGGYGGGGYAEGSGTNHLCGKCYSIDLNKHAQKLAKHLKRASDLGLPATLTLPEWFETVEYFHFSCAYCGGEFQCYEHFVPISSGGGTTKGNCIPSCKRCNLIKNDWNPMTDTPSRFEEARIDYIRQYLSQWS